MSKTLSAFSPWSRHISKTVPSRRYFSETISLRKTIPRLVAVAKEYTTREAFRTRSYDLQKPVVFGRDQGSPAANLPALENWFTTDEDDPKYSTTQTQTENSQQPLSRHFRRFRNPMVTYEIYAPTQGQKDSLVMFRDSLDRDVHDDAIVRNWDNCFSREDTVDDLHKGIINDTPKRDFYRFTAPLRLFNKIYHYNRVLRSMKLPIISAYIAQCPIGDLPRPLQDDLPTPQIIKSVGKGDMYDSSIWLGIAPTYTPLHRDPNPNFFCQLFGTKIIRLMLPKAGDAFFGEMQARMHKTDNGRLRTEDMMQGEERKNLHSAIWDDDKTPGGVFEVVLEPGDSMFIPSHYWHSVKSAGWAGEVNCSVNWWFR
ncbi:hypothetical protein FBEOM_102 [Fusarium beomiforme]|uniref:JmjC domain-containing protein n=1 Tax=Fusarium beomiforme TaxID=44412 RepID=A0A9P5AVV6_9HYPO|nr:hypothetical protein FBEOM_102 [Fusarium beomiforme]